MINLLPAEDKIAIKKERQRRLIVIIGIFAFGIISWAIILFIPSYFLLSSLERSLETQTSVLKETAVRNETNKIESSIAALNEKLALLAGNGSQKQISSALKKILDIQLPTIKITAFYYEKKGNKETLSVEGSADTRNSFLAFLSNLEKTDGIKNVSSPPANIIKEENISFRLTAELSFFSK